MTKEDIWIQTYSGKKFFPFRKIEHDNVLSITDIAHSLSMKCRFSGHCKKFYSVAEHSVLCADLVILLQKELKDNGYNISSKEVFEHSFYALLHDASESIFGDTIKPLKSVLKDVKNEEKTFNNSIIKYFARNFFSIDGRPNMLYISKYVDNCSLYIEYVSLMDNIYNWDFPNYVKNKDLIVDHPYCWSPKEAKRHFLNKYNYLYNILKGWNE